MKQVNLSLFRLTITNETTPIEVVRTNPENKKPQVIGEWHPRKPVKERPPKPPKPKPVDPRAGQW